MPHLESLELRQLDQRGRQPLELVVADLHKVQWSERSAMLDAAFVASHVEHAEMHQTADFGGQRSELVALGLAKRLDLDLDPLCTWPPHIEPL
jgi:hypothetical protein